MTLYASAVLLRLTDRFEDAPVPSCVLEPNVDRIRGTRPLDRVGERLHTGTEVVGMHELECVPPSSSLLR